jgi:hypothetical protein
MPAEVIYEDAYVRLALDRASRLMRYERTEKPFATIAEVGRVHDAVVKVVVAQPRSMFAMLVDLRHAPSRNDDEYEAAIEGYVAQLVGHFDRYALLVKTAAGRLQVTRLEKRANRSASHVHHDEAAALEYLGVDPGVTGKG